MTSVREDNSVAFKGTKQHWMSPQSKTLFTLKKKNKLMTWLKSGQETRCHILLFWNKNDKSFHE